MHICRFWSNSFSPSSVKELIRYIRSFSYTARYFDPLIRTTFLTTESVRKHDYSASTIHKSQIDPSSSSIAQLFPPTIATLLSRHVCPSEMIKVQGWITTCRAQKLNTFIHISDGSSERSLQVVVNEKLSNLHCGSAIVVEGQLKESLPGLEQPFELHTTKDQIRVLSRCDSSYPLQKKHHGIEFLRSFQHLRPKTCDFSNMLRTRSSLMHAFHEYCKRHDILYIHTPILTSSQCETGGEIFSVQAAQSNDSKSFFCHQSYLTVSGQLHLELFANGYPRVYTLSPCFRAEASQSSRHLAEFHMLEVEYAFLDSLPSLCTLVVDMLQNVIHQMANNKDIRLDTKRTSSLLQPFECIEYSEAISYFQRNGIDTAQGLTPEMEKALSEDLNRGIFIVHYPNAERPFYMKQFQSSKVENFDLILPHVGEVAGGSLRENNLEELVDRIKKTGMPLDHYQWYIDTRRYGSPDHGGFGLGFDRLILYLLAKENIKDCIGLPRIFEECRY